MHDLISGIPFLKLNTPTAVISFPNGRIFSSSSKPTFKKRNKQACKTFAIENEHIRRAQKNGTAELRITSSFHIQDRNKFFMDTLTKTRFDFANSQDIHDQKVPEGMYMEKH